MVKENKSNEIGISLSEQSIKEIVILLSDIDVKITELNEASTNDFMMLNTNLKNNYKLAQEISENAKELFEILSGKDRILLLRKLETFNTEIEFQIENFAVCVDKGSGVIESIHDLLSSVFIPIKNFRQNLITVNFLLANLKLNVTYLQNENFIFEESDTVIQKVRKIKEKHDIFDKRVIKLKALTDTVSLHLIKLRQRQATTLEAIIDKVQYSIKILNAKYQETSAQTPHLTKKTDNYFENISSIVTNLQYHDIIRQKMEHVQNTHKDIIDELNNFEFSGDESTTAHNSAKLLKIRDVASIQVAQLIHTNREYQDAIDKITKNFLEIGDDIKSVANMCDSFSSFSNLLEGQNSPKLIEKGLESSVELIKQFDGDSKFLVNKLKSIATAITEIKVDVTEITEDFESVLTDLTKIFNKIEPKKNQHPDVYELGKQLNNISHKIKDELNDLIDKFKSSESETILLESLIEHNLHTKFNQNLEKISENIIEVVKILGIDNNKLEKLLKTNMDVGVQLSMDIKTAIEQVKYYDFFEKVMEEIIMELNTILITVKSDSTVVLNKEEYTLKNLEHRYTMKSQRTIHNNVLQDKQGTEESEEAEEDIEFF